MSRAERVLRGDKRAAGQLMRDIDDGHPDGATDLAALYAHTGRARRVGITGNPGSGKSTLVAALIRHYRQRGETVGCVAVDPTSPFSGGAILADRVRMRTHYNDPGVYIRSVATRGALGGLSPAVWGMVHVLDAMGYDRVLVETVGVGQDEVDVVRLAHTAVVVTVPGLGDDMQALKAGVFEIADLFVINKADRPGVDKTRRHLTMLTSMDEPKAGGWRVPIVPTAAVDGEGVDKLISAIDEHESHLRDHGLLEERIRRSVEAELYAEAVGLLHSRLRAAMTGQTALVEDVVARRIAPRVAADELLRSAFGSTPAEGGS